MSIEREQQHGPAEKSRFRNLGISMDIPRIYHGYTSNDIPCISMDIPPIYLVDIHGISMYIPRISTLSDTHGIFMDIHVYPMYIGQDSIYMGYPMCTENQGST
jgi:hypothetical protein